jgi:Flp pilus assembly pilin Flp
MAFARLKRFRRGTSTIEYALVAGLIIVACIAIVAAVGTKVLARWNSVNATL